MKNIKVKAIVSSVCMTLMILTGCGNEPKEKVAMGRFVEQDIDVSAIVPYAISQNKEGEIEIIELLENSNQIFRYKLNQDNIWEKTGDVKVQWPEDMNNLLGVDMDSKGVICPYISEEGNAKISRILADGTSQSIALLELGNPCKLPENAEYSVIETKDGDWILHESWGGPVKLYNGKTGELINTYCEHVQSMQVLDDKLYVTTGWQEYFLNVYDISTGNSVESTIYPSTGENNDIFVDDQGTYLFNRSGIHYKAHGGQLWEEVVGASMTNFARQDISIGTALKQSDESFIVLFYTQSGAELKRYIYDENVPSKPSEEVTVFMWYEVPNVQQAVAIYQQAHPEVYVNVSIPNQDVNPQDALTSLNTELLAGGGPDLIILDGMPIETYIEKGLLVNISDILKSYIREKGGYSNIIETFKTGEKVYAIPSRCRVPMLWGKEEIVSSAHSLHELAEYKKAHPDEILFNKNMVELYKQLAQTCVNGWLDEKGNYSRDKVKTFIEDLEIICQEKEEDKISHRIDFESDKYPELIDVAEGKSQVFVLEARNPRDIMGAQAILTHRGEGSVAPFEIDGKGIYKVSGIMAINANSKKQDIAKEIIQIVLSDEVQGMVNWLGMPLSEKDYKLQEEQILVWEDMSISDENGRTLVIKNEIGEVYNRCLEIMKEANLYCRTEKELVGMIYDVIKEYSENGKSLDEALDELDQHLEIKNIE